MYDSRHAWHLDSDAEPVTSWEIGVAARTLAQEARGEPEEGQAAVAWVLRNRLQSGRWGKSLASVCLWRAQFSGWYVPSDPNFAYACGLRDDDPMLVQLVAIIQDVMASLAGADPTSGAMHYYATSMETPPPWVSGAVFCGQIGHHKFYKGVK